MNTFRPLYFFTLILAGFTSSCKKDSGGEGNVEENFFIQSSEASYDIDLCLDNSNNFYLTGTSRLRPPGTPFNIFPNYSLLGNGSEDAYVAKFNEDGKTIWATLLGGNNEETGYAVAADGVGNVYIAGTFRDVTRIGETTLELKKLNNSSGSANMTDMFLTSLDPHGKVRWVKQISGTGFERPTSIKVSPSGKVYVTGYFFHDIFFDANRLGERDQSGFFIGCYDNDGSLDWGKVYGVIPGSYSFGSIYPSTMKIASNGDLVIAGSFEDKKKIGSFSLSTTGDQDVFLTRLDKDGNALWVQTFGGTDIENCPGLAIDKDGNIYIGGSFRKQITVGSNTFSSAIHGGSSFLARYTATGTLVWARQVGLPGTQYIFDIAENNGKLHLVGYYDTEANIGDIKLNSNNNIQGFSAIYSNAGLPESAENLGTISGLAKKVVIDKDGFRIFAGTHYAPLTFMGKTHPAPDGYNLFIFRQN